MYNGVGVQTARGTGTSGYVQSNVSALSYSKQRKTYNAEEDIAKAEREVNRKPNLDLLDHERKRRIEIKCVELRDLMEQEGTAEEEIDEKVNEYRKLLFDEFEAGKLNFDDELDIRNTHSRAFVAGGNRERLKRALGISNDFVDGTSMAGMKKVGDQAAAALAEPEEDPEIALKRRLMEEIRAEEERKKQRKLEKKQKKEDKKRKKKEKERIEKSIKKEPVTPKRRRHSSQESSKTNSSDSEEERHRHHKRRHKEAKKSKKSSR